VRIGIGQNLTSATVSSTQPFYVDGTEVRSATFSTLVAVGDVDGVVSRADLETRMSIDIGNDQLILRAMDARVRIVPGAAPLAFGGRTWRGEMEVLGNGGRTLTVVNELRVEDYLRGVVPNELGPEAFPEIEALKAQSIAARTYIIRNLGQYAAQGFDICATDQCQVYFGMDTEHEMTDRAIGETRGQIATWQGEPINALYSSTCGGRTEDAANVFGEHLPYLVSTDCLYEHPEPAVFRTSRTYETWERGLLAIAGAGGFEDAGRFMGLEEPGRPADGDLESVAAWVKERFFPEIPARSPLRFLEQRGILEPGGDNSEEDVILRLLLRNGAFEWQDSRLVSWDGEVLRARVGAGIRDLRLEGDTPMFLRSGETYTPVAEAAWLGGERMQLRIVDDAVEALVYEPLPGFAAADRYSPLAHWETRLERRELNDAVRSLDIGELEDIVVLERGASGRVVRVEMRGTGGTAILTGPRLRTLLGLRDSLVYFEEARNARRELVALTFFGGGWGHGVGMCQVGAFGMAMEGATAGEILGTYYTGIEIEQVY
jgi:stage II sporulation protein D